MALYTKSSTLHHMLSWMLFSRLIYSAIEVMSSPYHTFRFCFMFIILRSMHRIGSFLGFTWPSSRTKIKLLPFDSFRMFYLLEWRNVFDSFMYCDQLTPAGYPLSFILLENSLCCWPSFSLYIYFSRFLTKAHFLLLELPLFECFVVWGLNVHFSS